MKKYLSIIIVTCLLSATFALAENDTKTTELTKIKQELLETEQSPLWFTIFISAFQGTLMYNPRQVFSDEPNRSFIENSPDKLRTCEIIMASVAIGDIINRIFYKNEADKEKRKRHRHLWKEKKKYKGNPLYNRKLWDFSGKLCIHNDFISMMFDTKRKSSSEDNYYSPFVARGQSIKIDYGINSVVLVGLGLGYYTSGILDDEEDYEFIIQPTELRITLDTNKYISTFDMLVGVGMTNNQLKLLKKSNNDIWEGQQSGYNIFLQGQITMDSYAGLTEEIGYYTINPFNTSVKNNFGENLNIDMGGFYFKVMLSGVF